jgi:hypothetical protein
MYIYHPKVRKFTKLFVNNYYKDIFCNDDEYYYDLILKGLKKTKKRLHIENDNTIVKLVKIDCGNTCLYYEEKRINDENKPVAILFFGIDKDRCLFVKIIDDYSYLEIITTDYLKKDIEDMIAFSVKYCMKNGVKKIYLNNNSKFYFNENPISLA